VTWMKRVGNNVEALFVGDEPVGGDSRLEIDAVPDEGKWNLVIPKTEPYDSAEYICQITTNPIQEQVHTLIVKGERNIWGIPTISPRISFRHFPPISEGAVACQTVIYGLTHTPF
jgi:hypothetical protein